MSRSDPTRAVTAGLQAGATTASDAGIAGGATLNAGSQVVTAVAGAAMGIVVARLLGPAGTGEFNVVLVTLLLAVSVVTLGVPTGLTYYVSSDRLGEGEAFRYAALASAAQGAAGFGLAVAFAALLAAGPFEGISLGTLALGLGALPFFVLWINSAALATACERYGVAAVPPAAQAFVLLVLVGCLTPFLDLTGAVLALFASHLAVGLAMAVWGLGRHPAGREWIRDAPAVLRRANAFGYKLYLSNFLAVVNQRVDLLILNAFVASATVGQYAIATAATLTATLLPQGLSLVLFPRVARLRARADADHDVTIRKAIRHVLLISVTSAAAIAPALLLIPVVYGSDFRPAIELGLILVPGAAALGIRGVAASATTGAGHPEYPLYTGLIVTPPTLLAYLVLIPALDATGAALASTVSYIVGTAIAFRFLAKATALPPFRQLLPGREELTDYRILALQARARFRARRLATRP